MSRTSHLGVVAYETESSWCEDVSSWGVRLPHVGKIDVSGLVRTKQPSNRLVGYRNDGTMPIPGPMSGSFSLSFYLTGHGSTTAGATSAGEVETFLGYILGSSASTGTGTTFTGGTAAAPTTTAASGFSAGGIIFAGAVGDGEGSAQPAVVSTHTGSTLTLLTALPAAPTTSVCYSSVVMHPEEIAANVNVQSLRFLLSTANLQYAVRGCYPTNIEFTGLGPGEIPMCNVTFGVSLWTHRAETFPGSDTMNDFVPAANSGGSLFFQARGTSTRATLSHRSFSLNYALGMQPMRGPGGVFAQQDIVGAVRTQDQITMEVVVDSEAATGSPTHAGNWDSDTQFYHLLLGLNAASTGQRVAFYFPNVCYDKERPVQVDVDNINRVRLKLTAYTGTTTTTDLTLSAMRMAWG